VRGRFVVLVMIVAAFLFAQPLHILSAQPSPSPVIELGYSPGSLTTTTTGVPVYTAGDEVWVMSESSVPYVLELSNPSGTVVASQVLEPQAPTVLYDFSSKDMPGTWALAEVLLQTSVTVGTLPLLVVGATTVPLNMSGYSLSASGNLSMSFTAASSSAYDFQACAVGSPAPAAASIPIPAALGSGNMQVTLNGSVVQIVPSGQVSASFSFWVELHQDYSYTDGGTSTVVSRDMEVASSTAVPIPVSSTNSTSSPVATLVHLRPGLFTLRAFFDSSSGLSAAEAPVLIPANSSTWIPIAGCSSTSKLPLSPFTLSSVLGASTQEWPTQVYLMYLVDGVEMYSATTLQIYPAAIDVVAAPWLAPFTDSELAFQLGPGVQQSASAGGLIFLTASKYPLTVSVSLLDGETQSVLIQSAYSYVIVPVNASQIVVDAVTGGKAAPGASITISADNITIAHARSGTGGTAVFYVPQGSYDVVGTFDNVTEGASVLTVLNNSSAIALNFPGSGGQSFAYAYLLIGTAAAGLIASALVWAKVYRGKVG